MIVVADTSPINYLLLIEEIDLLAKLYGRVVIPLEVGEELRRPRAPAVVRSWMEHPPLWLEIRSPSVSEFNLLIWTLERRRQSRSRKNWPRNN